MSFAGTAARGSAIGTAVSEGMVSYLADTNTIETYNGSGWVNVASAGTASYNFVTTLYVTSTTTFNKADYPWLRAIRVMCQGAGGGGGGCVATGAGQNAVAGGGGGGAYAEKFITDIAGLASSVTVTVGAGGTGGTAGNNAGASGGTSSFGALVSANGGSGGGGSIAVAPINIAQVGANGSTTGTGDLVISGSCASQPWLFISTYVNASIGGESVLGKSNAQGGTGSGANGQNGGNYGAGGYGGANAQNQATARSGGTGGAGIVIIELYA
jgi:hypothetical protein